MLNVKMSLKGEKLLNLLALLVLKYKMPDFIQKYVNDACVCYKTSQIISVFKTQCMFDINILCVS